MKVVARYALKNASYIMQTRTNCRKLDENAITARTQQTDNIDESRHTNTRFIFAFSFIRNNLPLVHTGKTAINLETYARWFKKGVDEFRCIWYSHE